MVKLLSLGLVELVHGDSDHAAKFYALSDFGWFYLYFTGDVYWSHVINEEEHVIFNSFYFRELMSPYFEIDTLNHMGKHLTFLFAVSTYLERCSQTIYESYQALMEMVRKITRSRIKPQDIAKSIGAINAATEGRQNFSNVFEILAKKLAADLENYLLVDANSMILDLCISGDRLHYYGYTESKHRGTELSMILASDKKFMSALEALAERFERDRKMLVERRKSF
jgi:hypothetical protein